MFDTYGSDLGLLWMRTTAAALLFWTNGWPKIAFYSLEIHRIDDPLGLGRPLTLWLALLAEVACPAAVALGFFTRLACVPIVVLMLVALLGVHPEWDFGHAQFGWLYFIVFIGLMSTGSGRFSLDEMMREAQIRMVR